MNLTGVTKQSPSLGSLGCEILWDLWDSELNSVFVTIALHCCSVALLKLRRCSSAIEVQQRLWKSSCWRRLVAAVTASLCCDDCRVHFVRKSFVVGQSLQLWDSLCYAVRICICGKKKTRPEHDLLIRPDFVLLWSWRQLLSSVGVRLLSKLQFCMNRMKWCEMYYKSINYTSLAGQTTKPYYGLPMEVAALKELLDKSSFPEGALIVTHKEPMLLCQPDSHLFIFISVFEIRCDTMWYIVFRCIQ